MTLLFYYLTFLNLIDAFVTWFGLENEFITELNPVMNFIYEVNPLLFICSKAALSLFLLLFIVFKQVPKSGFIKGITLFASFSYTGITLMHGFWLVNIL
ncbi:hypothetical protein DYI25_19455 [Mesobacillus boroniphilus]|uniref:DUF5658 domain-containing protein n=1 Tax=Mesobacillus boroniphilus TaxID=308892 RepID=A0A944GYC9_9BACI|nr:DUF5658 family protein [Mesobacillus boroniphilus]MBS8266604.1 hypothetical protein [Mesobacillus boroniphilus]